MEDREPITAFDRLKYFAVPAATVGIPLEVFGGGGAGLLLAGIVGGTAAYFSEEIRYGILEKISHRHGTNRSEKLHWFLTGNEAVTLEQIGEVESLPEQPDEPHEDDPYNVRLAELSTMPYQDYLLTPEWQERRQRIRARDGQHCQDCGATTALDVHHLTYDRRGAELDEDLVTLCHACHEKRHGIGGQMEAMPPKPRAQLAPPVAGLRAPTARRAFFTFSEVLASGFRPSLQKIYLATLEDGTQIFVPASKLCHVALAGLTRGGKSHLIRSLMIQLCVAGAEIYHLDPHYTAYDLEALDPTGKPCPEDWTPFLPYLSNDPRELVPMKQKYQIIEHYLRGAKQMVEDRMEMRGRSVAVGSPVFLFIDELPAIVDHIPDAPGCLKSILREGAKVGVYVVTASQDFLVKTLFPNEGGAIRDCYRTVLYVGGDAQTARILLDMSAKDVPENRLGKGRVMLRCDVVRPAQEARVPYVDNEALYSLLGPSTFEPGAYLREEEDALVSGLVAPAGHEEHAPSGSSITSGSRTGEVSAALRYHAQSGYEAYQKRKTERRPAVYVTARQQVPETPRGQDTELARGIAAYKGGAQTIDAFQAAMGFQTQHQARQLWALVKIAIKEEL